MRPFDVAAAAMLEQNSTSTSARAAQDLSSMKPHREDPPHAQAPRVVSPSRGEGGTHELPAGDARASTAKPQTPAA
jgi:hypothetical protein